MYFSLGFMNLNSDYFNILRKIFRNPNITQRKLAKELEFSLGKLNYLLKALKQKGLIKINNFKKNKNKVNYIYMLTPEGINRKKNMTINFMRKKMREYHELKKEIDENV